MADRYLRIEELTRSGGLVAVLAPLGLRRTVRTRVTDRLRDRVGGTAAVGERTHAEVEWRIEPESRGSRVALAARVIEIGVLDRLLFYLGGRWWLRRRFEAALGRLDHAVAAEAAVPAFAVVRPAATPAR